MNAPDYDKELKEPKEKIRRNEKKHFNELQIKSAKLLEKVSPIYQKYYLRNDDRLREQFVDGYKALECFLEKYAYVRQGSAAAYPKIALKCVSNILYQNEEKWRAPTKDDAKNIWEMYKQIAKDDFKLLNKKTGEAKVNKTRNPLNGDNGVIDKLASNNNNISNIAVYIRDLIKKSKTRDAHEFINAICGIGPKISSFYLRDIAYLSDLDEDDIKELHLLQPIDTWLEQTLRILFPEDFEKPPKTSENTTKDEKELDIKNNQKLREEYEKKIVDLCEEAGVLSISFNQGAWVLGSQIAGEFETFKRALTDYDFAQKIVEDHIKEKEGYLREVKNVLDSLRHTSHNSR